eukprot:jgi/Galph1/2480/GphlegSOOS_G1168.1
MNLEVLLGSNQRVKTDYALENPENLSTGSSHGGFSGCSKMEQDFPLGKSESFAEETYSCTDEIQVRNEPDVEVKVNGRNSVNEFSSGTSAHVEVSSNAFSKRIGKDWNEANLPSRCYSISPVSSHENSMVSEEGSEAVSQCNSDLEVSMKYTVCNADIHVVSQEMKNEDYFRLITPSERVFRQAVLSYRLQRTQSLTDHVLESSPLSSLFRHQGRIAMSSDDCSFSNTARPRMEIPFWNNRCRRAISLTLNQEDLVEDLEFICSNQEHESAEGCCDFSCFEKYRGRRFIRRNDRACMLPCNYQDDGLRKESNKPHINSHTRSDDRSAFKKRFREMFRTSKHRGFICCVYCGAECWAPNGRYHFNSCKVYNAREGKTSLEDDSASHVKENAYHSDKSCSEIVGNTVSKKFTRLRHWSDAARVDGFKKTMDRPGYVVCLQCGEHVWAPNSRRHAAACFLPQESRHGTTKRLRRSFADERSHNTSDDQNNGSISQFVNHDDDAFHCHSTVGDSESSMSKRTDRQDEYFENCHTFHEDHVTTSQHFQYSNERDAVSSSFDSTCVVNGVGDASPDFEYQWEKSNKNKSTASSYRRCSSRKGWLECRHCGAFVWPPNALRHMRTCEK